MNGILSFASKVNWTGLLWSKMKSTRTSPGVLGDPVTPKTASTDISQSCSSCAFSVLVGILFVPHPNPSTNNFKFSKWVILLFRSFF
jgi:hypothetical protein